MKTTIFRSRIRFAGGPLNGEMARFRRVPAIPPARLPIPDREGTGVVRLYRLQERRRSREGMTYLYQFERAFLTPFVIGGTRWPT